MYHLHHPVHLYHSQMPHRGNSSVFIHSLRPSLVPKLGQNIGRATEKRMRIAHAMMVLTGLTVSTLALAAPPPWSNSRHNRGYHDGYDYAPVRRVEPIV